MINIGLHAGSQGRPDVVHSWQEWVESFALVFIVLPPLNPLFHLCRAVVRKSNYRCHAKGKSKSVRVHPVKSNVSEARTDLSTVVEVV